MRKTIATGSAINVKTGKRIRFRIPETISKKGLESLAKNVVFETLRIPLEAPIEKLEQLFGIKMILLEIKAEKIFLKSLQETSRFLEKKRNDLTHH